jgi:hypothetical protein
MKTHLIVLRDFSLEEFKQVKRLVTLYPHHTTESRTRQLQFIRQALSSVQAKGIIQFHLTKKEFEFLIIVLDIMSVGAWRWNLTFGIVHSFFTRLNHRFIEMFKEDTYASADNGVSTLNKSEPSIGGVLVGSSPTARANQANKNLHKKAGVNSEETLKPNGG